MSDRTDYALMTKPIKVHDVKNYDIHFNPESREVTVSYHCESVPSFAVRLPDAMALEIIAHFLKQRLYCLH